MDGSLTMWIILGALVAIILSMFTYSAIKSKITKKRKAKKDAEFKSKTAEQVKLTIVKLNSLIDINNEYLQKFEPSIGSFKMNDIVQVANNYLNNMQNDLDFREYIVNSDTAYDFLKYFVRLSHTRCNNWAKQCSDIKEYLEKEIKVMDTEFVEEKTAQESIKIRQFYEKGLFNNDQNEPAK
ncbi:MHJ_0274 family protein [Mycoplasmopsis primatum]|uniref:MHJ_0274 family protein n=1 Tax=Mycoplasmopsis primatum TaxID=55604 RepID=UPI000497B48F|nr:hypothetical protein [Mycoplasmopsis primatum]